MSEQTPFVHQLRVPYAWTDAQARVFYANYLLAADEARYAFWDSGLGLGSEAVKDIEHAFFVVHLACDYHDGARFHDLLSITVEPHDLGRTSLSMSYRISDAASGEAVFSARCVYVWADQQSGRPAPWPEHIRAALLARYGDGVLKST